MYWIFGIRDFLDNYGYYFLTQDNKEELNYFLLELIDEGYLHYTDRITFKSHSLRGRDDSVKIKLWLKNDVRVLVVDTKMRPDILLPFGTKDLVIGRINKFSVDNNKGKISIEVSLSDNKLRRAIKELLQEEMIPDGSKIIDYLDYYTDTYMIGVKTKDEKFIGLERVEDNLGADEIKQNYYKNLAAIL